MTTLKLAIAYAMREMRGGLRGFYVFVACIALGVMTIAGVGAVSRSLVDGLAREGRIILGGDIAFTLVQRDLTDAERGFLATRGALSTISTMRAMVRAQDERLALVEVKAVDGAYPLTGAVALEPAGALPAKLAREGDAFGAVADPLLLARLNLKIGERVRMGDAQFILRATLAGEPDKLAAGLGFGPRLLISQEALAATHLVQPGSIVRWTTRLRLREQADVKSTIEAANAAFPQAGWDIRTRDNASPQLERNIERFTQYLTLVGLAALVVGGVGVANAVRSHLDRKRDTIATLKAMGASGTRIVVIYLTQILLLAALGSLIGIVIGGAMPFIVMGLFGAIIPLPLEPTLHVADLGLAFAYGLLTAMAFSIWPIGRAHDVPVSELFRDAISPVRRWPRARYIATTALAIAAFALVAIVLAYERKVAAIFTGASFAVFVLLMAIAALLMALARRAPRARKPMLRLAIANIHRPGALTPAVVLSLGLGLALLVTVTQIDANLRRQFMAALPDHAPSFYFVDIPSADADRFDTFLKTHVPHAATERVPMLRGRIISLNGIPASEVKPTSEAAWVLQSDRGLTYAREVPAGSRVVEGTWWGDDDKGEALVSFERKIAQGLGLKLGDKIVVNILGRDIEATISNLRDLDWQSLSINFVMVFSPSTLRGAPHTHIATLTVPDANAASEALIMKAVADAFPMVTIVRVREALDAIGGVITNLTLAIRGASAITILAAMLVLGGALAAGHRHRVYDAVILKTLGATRARLMGAYAIEYGLIGFVSAVFGVLAGSLAAWMVVTKLMNLGFVWFPVSGLIVAALALAVTVLMGLIGTLTALGQKPASVLRHL